MSTPVKYSSLTYSRGTPGLGPTEVRKKIFLIVSVHRFLWLIIDFTTWAMGRSFLSLSLCTSLSRTCTQSLYHYIKRLTRSACHTTWLTFPSARPNGHWTWARWDLAKLLMFAHGFHAECSQSSLLILDNLSTGNFAQAMAGIDTESW